MKTSIILLACASLLSIAAVGAPKDDGRVTVITSQKLANAPGNALNVVLVTYPPGGKTPKHHHGGSVFGYVLSGVIRSQDSATGPVRTYGAGESFFEPAGTEHLVSENPSKTKEATLLAVIVGSDRAARTTFDL